MENKHTPGPWHRNIAPAKKYNTVFSGRNTHVAHLAINSLTDDELEANANLISAAPELLSTLQLLVLQVQRGKSITEDHLIYKDAVAAINKATNIN